MNAIDIAIIILLLWGAINGFIKGFVVQSLTLAALVLGVWAGAIFYEAIGKYLAEQFSVSVKIMQVIAFTLIFIAVLVIMHFISKLLTNVLGKSVLGKLNRIGGIVFGIAKMAFITSVFIVIIQKFDTKHKLLPEETTCQSALFGPVSRIAPAIFPHLHLEEIKDGILTGKSQQK
ncbi:MAG TPA: CvpA family protein [Bacteroidales bacterium]|nr:CvpA family protein [Bacteroidales bacterium]